MNLEDKKAMLTKLQNGSDIRGVAVPDVDGVPANLMFSETEAITRGFIEVLKEKALKKAKDLVIAVGCDSRVSGPYLKDVVLNTLKENNVTAIDCGLASTPAMFMSTKFSEFSCDGSIMITASHLPYNRNGFKYFDKAGGFQKEDIKNIIGKAQKYYSPAIGDTDKKAILEALPISQGSISQKEETKAKDFSLADAYFSKEHENPKGEDGTSFPLLMDIYAKHLRDIICKAITGQKPLSGLSISIDAGNGAGGFYASKVLAPLGADVSSSQFLEPDGTFPNHIPNPENKEAMASITKAVKESNADLGIIFDTDVDRSGAVTGSLKEVARNGIVALAAALISKEHRGGTVVTDSITSDELTQFLEEELGLVHLRFKRGYKNVINKAMELEAEGIDCPLAIETSGHAAFKENYFLDDGAYLATKIIIEAALLKKKGQTIDDILSRLKEPAEATETRIKITCDDFATYGDTVLLDFENWVKKSPEFTLTTSNYEGVRAQTETGWVLLRKSLHDPVMPMNIESREIGGAEKIKKALLSFLKSYEFLDIN